MSSSQPVFSIDPAHPGTLSEEERCRYVANMDRLRTLGWHGVESLGNDPPVPDSSRLLVRAPGGHVSLFYSFPTGQQSILHHLEDPDLKAAEWWSKRKSLDPQTGTLHLGLGLGYSIPSILEQADAGAPFLIVEPDTGTFASMLAFRDIEPLIRHPRIRVCLLDSPQRATEETLRWFQEMHLPKYRWVVEPPGMLPAPLFLRDWFESLAKAMPVLAPTLARELRRNYPYPSNLAQNWNEIQLRPGIANLFGQLEGAPVVVVGAGPSLDDHIPRLKEFQEKVIILACDTAVRPLLSAGVRVDLALAMDSSPANHKHFQDLPSRDFIPCLYAGVHPPLLQEYLADAWIAASSFFPTAELLEDVPGPNSYLMNKGWLTINGSVGSSALDFALRLGASEVFLAGLDLAYPKGRDHASGTLYDHDPKFQERQPGSYEVPSVAGGTVRTATAFLASLLGTTHQVGCTQVPVFNLSERGALIPGTRPFEEGWARLREIAESETRAEPPRERLRQVAGLSNKSRRRPRQRCAGLTLETGFAIDNRGRFSRHPTSEDAICLARRNLEILAELHPSLAAMAGDSLACLESHRLSGGEVARILRGPEGYPRLLVENGEGKTIAALPVQDSPWEELSEWELGKRSPDSEALLMLGLGLGFHLRDYLEARPNNRVWVWEPYLDRFRLSLACGDLADLLQNPRVHWSLGESASKVFLRMIRETPGFLEQQSITWRPWIVPGFRNWAQQEETGFVELWVQSLGTFHPIPKQVEVRPVAASDLDPSGSRINVSFRS